MQHGRGGGFVAATGAAFRLVIPGVRGAKRSYATAAVTSTTSAANRGDGGGGGGGGGGIGSGEVVGVVTAVRDPGLALAMAA